MDKCFDYLNYNLKKIPRTLKIPRIRRHFQELLKYSEKFFDRPPITLYSPNTKSNCWPKVSSVRIFENFQEHDVISKNF